MPISMENNGASSKAEIRLTVPAPQPPDLSQLYAALPQHLNLLAIVAPAETVRQSRQRIAENIQTHDWEAIAAVAADFFERKGATLAAKFVRLGFTLDSTSFADELARIKRHHQALVASTASF